MGDFQDMDGSRPFTSALMAELQSLKDKFKNEDDDFGECTGNYSQEGMWKCGLWAVNLGRKRGRQWMSYIVWRNCGNYCVITLLEWENG